MKKILLDLQKSTTRPTASKKFKNILPMLKEEVIRSNKPAEIFHAIINDLDLKPICKFCGNEKTFYGIDKGYSNTCGSKSCAAKYSFEIHTELKHQFTKGRPHREESKKKISEKAKIYNSNPEKIEKTRQTVKKKYGVDNVFQLNEVKEKSKETCLEKYGVEYNMQRNKMRKMNSKWGASPERRASLENSGRWIPLHMKSDFEKYCLLVMRETNKHDITKLKNYEKRGVNAYHLDHKYSKYQGFLDNIPPHIIGSIKNLEFIDGITNIQKGKKCSVRLEDLI